MTAGLTSVAPNITSDTLQQITTSLSPVVQQQAQVAASVLTSASQTLTSSIAPPTSTGAGLTGIASELAQSFSGGAAAITQVSTSLAGISSLLSSSGGSLTPIGISGALSSALSSLGGAGGSTYNGWSQIPSAAKGLESNGPQLPQGFSLGPLGNINVTDFSSLFNTALLAVTQAQQFTGFKQS